MTPDIRIVKELPKDLQSLDLEAVGSVVSSLSKLILNGHNGWLLTPVSWCWWDTVPGDWWRHHERSQTKFLFEEDSPYSIEE